VNPEGQSTAIGRRAAASMVVAEARLARRINRYPYFSRVESAAGPRSVIAGKAMLNFGSNNYLGLADDPRIIGAATNAVRRWGTGVTGSRLLNGNLALHESLEDDLAAFYGRESALVFPTGYTANLGALTGLLQPGDRVFLDHEAHASLFDGVLLARSKLRRFRHNSVEHLASLLPSDNERERGRACIIEGTYSMLGDTANARSFAELCKATGTFLIVDEAHSLGTAGPTGAGVAERDGVLRDVDLITTTFSKSLASCGGAVIGDRSVIDAIRLTSRPFIFTASNTPSSVAAAQAALHLLIEEPAMVAQVHSVGAALVDLLLEAGVEVNPADGPIVTIRTGSDFATLQAWRLAWNRGLFCNAVVSPAVAAGEGLLRLSVMRTHTKSDLEEAAEICASATGRSK
jgi:8-amino-7-oxononanoate synthase